eukprot:tig00001094_g6991.t1
MRAAQADEIEIALGAEHPQFDFRVLNLTPLDERPAVLPHVSAADSRWKERRFGKLNGLVYTPSGAGATASGLIPTILFLHGRGESGDKPRDLVKVGLPEVLERDPFPFTNFPFAVLAPQCPWRTDWGREAEALAEYLSAALAALPLDPARVYLTGMSMGGFGALALAQRLPDRFAALAPVCAGAPERNASAVARAIKHIPTWVIHGEQDEIIPAEYSKALIAALQAAGAPVLRTTLYPQADHDSWTATYEDPEFYRFFLAHASSGGSADRGPAD